MEKQMGREADNKPSIVDVTNKCSYISTPHTSSLVSH